MSKHPNIRRISLLSTGLAVVFLAAPPARAQEAGTAQIEEVVVTAQKRSENVQDVPKSVAVANTEALEKAGATRLVDLSSVFPSLTNVNQGQNAKPPGIRGIATFANAASVQPKTGIVVDDIPQPAFSTLANELSDIERVEVFAGPQSTLSGRNAAGGLINFVTKAPSSVMTGELKVEQTDDDQTRVAGFVSGPLGDTVGFSLSAFSNDWDGAVRNIATGRKLGGFDSTGFRGKLKWSPTDRLDVLLTGYDIKSRHRTGPVIAGGPFVAAGANPTFSFDTSNPRRSFAQLYPGITVSPDNVEIYAPQDGTAKTHDRGLSLRIDYDLGSLGTLSSLSNISKSNQPRTDVMIGIAAPLNQGPDLTAFTDVDTDYKSQEFRLVSPGDQDLTYTLGFIYTDTDQFQPYHRLQTLAVNWDRTSRIKSAAVFARGTYALTPADSLTAGLRYQTDDLGYTWRFLTTGAPPFRQTAYSAGKSDYDFWGGELSYRHEFTEAVSGYVTLSSAESGKAYDTENNAVAATGVLTPLASEKVKNVEIGFKSQFFDRRLTLNGNIYRADYENYQVQSIDSTNPNAAPVIVLLAIGKVRTEGVELSSGFRVTPNLQLSLSGLYNHAYIRDYPNAPCYTRQSAAQGCLPAAPPLPARQANLSGLSLQGAPKYKVNAGVDYRVELSQADLDFGLAYRYQSSSRFDSLGDPTLVTKGYSVVNVSAGVSSKDGKYSAQVFVNNLFDKVFYAGIGNAGQIDVRSAAYDRNSFRYAGVRLSARY